MQSREPNPEVRQCYQEWLSGSNLLFTPSITVDQALLFAEDMVIMDRLQSVVDDGEDTAFIVPAAAVEQWKAATDKLEEITKEVSDEELRRWARFVLLFSNDDEALTDVNTLPRRDCIANIAIDLMNAAAVAAKRRAENGRGEQPKVIQ